MKKKLKVTVEMIWEGPKTLPRGKGGEPYWAEIVPDKIVDILDRDPRISKVKVVEGVAK